MARVKTFANGGSLLPGDLNAIEDDYEFAFSTYKPVLVQGGQLNAAVNATTYLFAQSGAQFQSTGGAGTSVPVFYLDPGDLTGNTRVNKYRLKVALFTNATAPTSTFTLGLYPVTAAAGGANVNTFTTGVVVAGSTVTFTAPASSTQFQGNSGDFSAPAAGYYVLGCNISTTMVANSQVQLGMILQNRQV